LARLRRAWWGSSCSRDAPGQGDGLRGRPERDWPKVAGMVRCGAPLLISPL
jgi:hypothetical protein